MFMAQHYNCCKSCGDATEAKQDLILAAIAAIGVGGGSGDASEATQLEIQAEVEKLTRDFRLN